MAEEKKDDTKTTSPTPAKQDKDTMTVNLHNPTSARRIIHDGITVEGLHGGTQKQITVGPGETVKNVTIHKIIAEELRQRNKIKRDSDLIVKPLTDDVAA